MSIFTPQERVAVIRGGQRSAHKASLAHGAVVLDVLNAQRRYMPLDVVITPQGEWLYNGFVVSPERILSQVDMVYNAALGAVGEDGSLARVCARYGVPHQSATTHAAYSTWYKPLAVDTVKRAGYAVPARVLVDASAPADIHTLGVRLHETYGDTFVVKPAASSFRSAVTRTESVTKLADAVTNVLNEHPHCIIEQYIPGHPVTVTSVPGLRNVRLYHSPVMTWEEDFFSAPQSTEVLRPAALSRATTYSVYEMLDQLYALLDLRGAVKTDLVVGENDTIYFLEVNSLSSLVDGAPMAQSLAEVGVDSPELIAHQLQSVR
jgi:D-alanine-D-alanine ligase